MTELSKLTDQALPKEIKSGRETVSRLDALDAHEVVRSGRADTVLAELQAACDMVAAAKAEVARRTDAKPQGRLLPARLGDRALRRLGERPQSHQAPPQGSGPVRAPP